MHRQRQRLWSREAAQGCLPAGCPPAAALCNLLQLTSQTSTTWCTARPPLCLQAFLYCPSEPSDCALKLHSTLQRFAWTEAEASWHACVPH